MPLVFTTNAVPLRANVWIVHKRENGKALLQIKTILL